MEFAVGTLTYELAGVPLYEAVDRIHNHGVKYVDMIAYSDYNPTLLSVEMQKEVGKKMKAYGMRASSVTACPRTNLGTSDPKEREEGLEFLKQSAKLVKRTGGKLVTIGAGVGNIDYFLSREEATKNAAALVKEFCKWAQKEDVYIALELEPEALYVLNSLKSMKALLDAIDEENCCANIDIGHFHILRENPEGLSIIKDKIVHMHVSDNHGFAHVNGVVGSGNINFEWFIETIHKLGVDQNCARFGDVAVAGIEIGEPGHLLKDPDNQVLKSIGNLFTRVPLLRDKAR